jgi:CDP-glucose 4,6-dehydratase
MSFWEDRNVLVTGASGLLGSWLVDALLAARANVVCLVRDWVPNSRLFVSGAIQRAQVVRGELEDLSVVLRTINEYEVDSVFHLGAQTIVGTAARSAAHDRLPYTENAPLQGRFPYDVSKSCADLISLSYAHTYGVPVTVTRCGNLYGGGDLNFNRLIPGTIRSASRDESPIVRSDGSYIRDYFYVQDAVEAYLRLAESLPDESFVGEAFNFGNEEPLDVLSVVGAILRVMGKDTLEPTILNEASAEIRAQYLDCAKARQQLSWRARFDLETGLRETVAWYERWLSRDAFSTSAAAPAP